MRLNSFFCFLLAVIGTTFFPSCKKDKIELLTQEISSGTSYALNDVVFVNDSVGYVCGGERWRIGIMLRTTNGGKTWSQPDSIYGQSAYTCYFFTAAEGYVAGNSSFIGYTTDSAKSFSISETNYRLINDIMFIGKQRIIKVGGEGYAKGYIDFSNDYGNSWKQTEFQNSIVALSLADNNTVFASGFGVIYRSTDGGENFSALDVRGDLFLSSDFPSSKVGYFAGYEKKILKTTDAGNSFTTVMKGNMPFSKREYFRAIKFWDENIGYVVGDNGVMYRTLSGGDAWQQVEQFTDVNLRAIHLFSSSSGIVVGDNGKIFLFRK